MSVVRRVRVLPADGQAVPGYNTLYSVLMEALSDPFCEDLRPALPAKM
jgi:hypothetical protein